jgi:tetratricopeptide (TPR) repeat protein
MKPFDRLRQAAQVFRTALPDKPGWFDTSNPDCLEAERLLEMGQPAEAEALFERAFTDPRQSSRPRRQQARMRIELATSQLRQNKLAEAERNALDAQALLDEPKAGTWIETPDCLDLLGRIAQQRGDLGEAEARLRRSIELLRDRRDTTPTTLAAALRRLGSVLDARGEHDQAIEQFEAAVETARKGCGDRSVEVADALMDLSHVESARGNYPEARQLAEKALAIHRSACGNDSAEAAQDLETMAGYSRTANDLDAACTYLEQAMFVRERQIGGSSSQMAMLLMALADIHSLLGRLAPALELMQQAVGRLTPAKDENFATALEKLGTIYSRTGRQEDAYQCYSKARQVWEQQPNPNQTAIAANSEFLSGMESLLPALEQPPANSEPEDSGISVLLPQHSQPQPEFQPSQQFQPPRQARPPQPFQLAQQQQQLQQPAAQPSPQFRPAGRPAGTGPLALMPNMRPSHMGRLITVLSSAPQPPQIGEIGDPVAPGDQATEPVPVVIGFPPAPVAAASIQGPVPVSIPMEPQPAAPPAWFGWEDLTFDLMEIGSAR